MAPIATLIATLVLLLGYAVLCVGCWVCHRRRFPVAVVGQQTSLLIAYASQGGRAEALARHWADLLTSPGETVSLLPLNRVEPSLLSQVRRALFVVSTYGEGEPPDNGALFARRYLVRPQALQLPGTSYAVLALGDSRYRHFCGFGKQLHSALRRGGGRPLFKPVVVDREDGEALRHWHRQIVGGDRPLHPNSLVGGTVTAPTRWRLVQRDCLNPGSPGAPIHFLRFMPEGEAARQLVWQAGDIAQIRPGPAPGELREYTLACLPGDGALELLVREHCRPDGSRGLCSGWLGRGLGLGECLELSLRCNCSFHPPPLDRPLILIGNGTGIAGLRAHLLHRVRAGASGGSWLLFGERTARHDSLFAEQLESWRRTGCLQRLDRTFSRDPGGPTYVQHALEASAEELKCWVDRGASLYLCGSRRGMASEVDRVLRRHLGEEGVQRLLDQSRYCRDVY